MGSIGEQIAQDQIDKAKKAAARSIRPAGKISYKGLCLIIRANKFTTKTLMAAVKQCLYQKTGDIAYSNRNIRMNTLKKSGKVSTVSETVTQENMRFFDTYCKQYGIKYSAMLDKRDPEAPQYLVFYQSDHADLIMKALQEGFKDYSKAAGRGKEQGKEAGSGEKDSVVGKLYSFRSGLEHSVSDTPEKTAEKTLEKVKSHEDPAR